MELKPVMSVAEVTAFIDAEFPQIHIGGRAFHVESLAPGRAVVRLQATESHLRPGGTISGPAMFALADLAAYVAILAHIGPVALAVTTNLTINFLRKPPLGPLFGEAKVLKLGRRLAVMEIAIVPGGQGDAAAHAVATYSIPPR